MAEGIYIGLKRNPDWRYWRAMALEAEANDFSETAAMCWSRAYSAKSRDDNDPRKAARLLVLAGFSLATWLLYVPNLIKLFALR
jgi:hypothetical protein